MPDNTYQRATVSNGPRRFMPLDVNIDRTPEPSQGFWGNLADSYAGGFWGATKDAVDRVIARQRGGNYADPNFDPLNAIPKGYEDFAETYMYAANQSEVEQITRNIDENKAIRGRQSQLSGGENFLYGVISGILDPVNFIGVELKGLSFLQGAAKGGAVYGGINAAQEVFRNTVDPTVSDLETGTNIGFGFLLSGVLSGASAHFSGGGAGRVADDVRAKADAVGDRYAETFARMEGNPLTEVIDFNGQGVRIVEGNTGKYDRNGNYVTAFFRPKEAFEAAARDEQIAKAVDDALGDVIPDGEDLSIPVLDNALDSLVVKIEQALPNQENGKVKPALEPDDVARLRAQGVPVDENGSLSVADAQSVIDSAKGATKPDTGTIEDTIFVDTAAVMARFKEKPWANPRYEGIDAFADDAFQTPQEWLNFTILHELNHKTTKRLPSETVAQYENRINRMAYDEMKAGRLPLSPTDGALEKLMLLPTPAGELMRLAPRNRDVHDLAQGIAGDHATLTIANQMGKATTPGGSVFQRAQRWLYANYIVGKSWRTAYAEYLTGKAPESEFGIGLETLRGSLPVIGARSKGKLTPTEFRAYVGRATNSDQPFAMFGKALSDEDMALVRRAAGDARKVLAEFEVKARELGMFDAQKRINREIAWRERANQKATERLARFKGSKVAQEIEEGIAKRTAELDDLRTSLDELASDAITPPGEQYYFPRVFDVGRIKDEYDKFLAKIANAYGGDEEALGRAKVTVDRIIGEGGEDFLPGAGTPKNLKSRQIPLTNEELADWLVWDVETIIGMYSRRMGASLEMVNKYGSRMLDEQLDDLNGKLIDQGIDLKTRRKIINVQEDLRDKVLGRFHGQDPMSWNNRAARAIKNYASITLMGKAIYSQTMDMFRTIATEGFAPVGKALHAAARGELKDLAKGSYAKQAGEALEMVNASWMARMIESDSAIAVTNQSALERGLAAAQSPFFTLNLMNPFATIWKDFTSTMSAHMLIDEAVKVAGAVRAGKTLETLSKKEAKMAAHLASWGIDLRGAQMIADMPFEKTEGTGLYLANMEAWSGRDGERARDLILGAINGTVRSSVVSPGPLQRPAIMDGVYRWNGERKEAPLASLPFQLMSFTLASSSKLTHSLLSGRDRNVAASLGILMVGGMITTWLKADNFEQMEWEEFMLNSFENSSIAGYLTDVYKRAETLTGYGPRKALDMYQFGEDQVSDQIGAVAGPGVGALAGAMEAFINPELTDQQRAGLVKRSIPFAGLLYWSDTLKQWSKDLADAGMMPEPIGIGNMPQIFDDEPAEVVLEETP